MSAGSKNIAIVRPILGTDGCYETQEMTPFKLWMAPSTRMTVVQGSQPIASKPPPAIPLNTEEPLDILRLLECAGVQYASPDCEAAEQGIELFGAARRFALNSAPDWVGFDWDFTTNIFKIYSPLLSLLAIKLLPLNKGEKFSKPLRFFEAAKPGMHELIVGMAIGYALRQGLRNFLEWEYYRPQVRFVTQTWPDRLAKLGTIAVHLIPFAMGKFPGTPITEDDVRQSDAFITLEDFFDQIRRLLSRFQDSGYRFQSLAEREQDEVMEMLKIEKGYMLKPLSTFTAKGWMPPQLIFDDSPASNSRLIKDGVRVVHTYNPLVPKRELTETKTISVFGRSTAARQMITMASRTEGPALIEVLEKLARGESEVEVSSRALVPTPKGTVFVLHDLSGPIEDVLFKLRQPQREIKRLLKNTRRAAGGIKKIKRDYLKAAELRRTRIKTV